MESDTSLAWGLMATDYQERLNVERMRRERLAKTRDKLRQEGIAAALLTGHNLRYATGIRSADASDPKTARPRALVFADDRPTVVFLTSNTAKQVRKHCPWLEPDNVRALPMIGGPSVGPAAAANTLAKEQGLIIEALTEAGVKEEPIGFDGISQELRTSLEKAGVDLRPVAQLMLEAREIKTVDEITCMKMAGLSADIAFTEILSAVKPGVLECELCAIGMSSLARRNAEHPYVVSIRSGALNAPNWTGLTTDKALRPGDIGVVYIGGNIYLGYHTCYYRTFVVGQKPSQRQRDWYKKALEWQYAAQEAIKPGVSTADVAKVFPTCSAFGFSSEEEVAELAIAHGQGLEGHDLPHIHRAWSFDYPQPIREGQVIAVEFWYGEEGVGGVRIQNEGVVTSEGWVNYFSVPYDGILLPPFLIETVL